MASIAVLVGGKLARVGLGVDLLGKQSLTSHGGSWGIKDDRVSSQLSSREQGANMDGIYM